MRTTDQKICMIENIIKLLNKDKKLYKEEKEFMKEMINYLYIIKHKEEMK